VQGSEEDLFLFKLDSASLGTGDVWRFSEGFSEVCLFQVCTR